MGDIPLKKNSHIFQFLEEDEASIEIQNLLAKCEHETGEYFSPIFIRQKPGGSCRLILNLINLNEDMP